MEVGGTSAVSPGKKRQQRRRKYKDAGPGEFVSKDAWRAGTLAGNKDALTHDARQESTRRLAFEAERAIYLKKQAQKTALPTRASGRAIVDASLSPLQKRLAEQHARKTASSVRPGATKQRVTPSTSLIGRRPKVRQRQEGEARFGGAGERHAAAVEEARAAKAATVADAVLPELYPMDPPNDRPVHPDDPVPSTLELQPQSMKLEEDILIKVCYTHPTFGFRNEQMAIPASMKVAALGAMLIAHTGVERERFNYVPNSRYHVDSVQADVGAHARRVHLENTAMSVKKWGLKTGDCITVRSTKVVVPKPSREDLLLVKTSSWKSEADGVASTPLSFGSVRGTGASRLTKLQSPLAGGVAGSSSRLKLLQSKSSTNLLKSRLKKGASGASLVSRAPSTADESALPMMSPVKYR